MLPEYGGGYSFQRRLFVALYDLPNGSKDRLLVFVQCRQSWFVRHAESLACRAFRLALERVS